MHQDEKRHQYSQVGYSVMAGSKTPSNDAVIKRLFSNREVLAQMLQLTVEEYRGFTCGQIARDFLPGGKILIRESALHMGETAPQQVQVSGQESRNLAEGTTMFDVVLQLPAPGKPDQSIGVVVNIEVQNDDSPGYPIVKRMLYYLCRLMSMQRETVFTKSQYDRICKVYSLWVCPRLAGFREPSVDRYAVTRTRIYGKDSGQEECREDYDLLEGLIIRFSGDVKVDDCPLISYLQLLLLNTDTPDKRLKELEEKFHITTIRETDTMYFEQALFLHGQEQGIKKGIKIGEEKERERMQMEILIRMEQQGNQEEQIMAVLGITSDRLQELRKRLSCDA